MTLADMQRLAERAGETRLADALRPLTQPRTTDADLARRAEAAGLATADQSEGEKR